MAQKRKAQEAFGKSNGQLSAVAAAKQARQRAKAPAPRPEPQQDDADLASSIAGAPYDGHHDGDSDSEAEGIVVEEPVAARTPPKPSVRLSNFKRTKDNVLEDSYHRLELSLKADEFVTFIGEYQLEVKKGVVSIHGAMLHPNSGRQRVYALSTQALPAVVARKDESIIKIASVGDSYEDSVQSLNHYSPLFRNIGVKDDRSSRSFQLLAKTSDDPLQRPLVPLEVDEDTKRVYSRVNARLDSDESAPCIMAIGAKSSGKSTFNRLLCNMIITRPQKQRCYYLDLDPGQPEFGPPGQISLVEVMAPILGPSFTHPASIDSKAFRLVRSHTIAATSFKDNPDHYIDCVEDLALHTPRDAIAIVNSCGWVTGLGTEVLLDIIAQLNVTDVVALGQLDATLMEDVRSRLTTHQVSRRQGRASARTPAELRAMQTVAYFHQKERSSKGTIRWNHKLISKIRPWIVSYSGSNSGIEAVLSYGQAPQPEFLAEVLDGSIVAIMVHDPDRFNATAVERTANEDLPYIISKTDGFSFPINPQQSHCIGLALVRGIDTENKKLQLVTPLPESQIANLMQRKVVLVRGSFDPPEWAYLEDLHDKDRTKDMDTGSMDVEDDRPWVTLREPVGVEGSVWRLRHPPTRDTLR